MHAHLVRAARFQPTFDKGGFFQRLLQRPMRHGPLALTFADDRHFFAIDGGSGEGSVDCA